MVKTSAATLLSLRRGLFDFGDLIGSQAMAIGMFATESAKPDRGDGLINDSINQAGQKSQSG